MFLQKLELVGFKSFAKRTVLNFEPGITAVVGPNGSGKSNIADAIRWVLGAQSKKAVRGKVGSDVIFSGTAAKPAMSLAEVSLTFDNSSKKLPYEYEEVVVTRRLYRSGDSEYLVNGAKVRLADLQHAFAVAGIGAENYTVISQGMVDQVLSQSATARRGLFEEAAGVRQFYLRRDEARRKLSETTTNLSRVEDIVSELEPRLKLLRRQAKAIAAREEIESQLKDAYRARFGHRFRELAKGRGAAKAKQDDLGREFTAMQTELEKLTKDVDELRRSQQGLKLNDLLGQRDKLRDQKDELQRGLNQAVTAREVAQSGLEQQRGQREHFETRLSELKKMAPAAVQADDPELQTELTAAEQALAAIEGQYGRLTDALETDTTVSLSKDLESAVAQLEAAIEAGASGTELKSLVTALRSVADRFATLSGTGDGKDISAKEILAKRDAAYKQLQELKVQTAARDEANKVRREQSDRQSQEVTALEEQIKQSQADEAARKEAIEASIATIEQTTEQLKALDTKVQELDAAITIEEQSSLGDTEALEGKEAALRAKQRTYEEYRTELAELNLELAKLETRLDDLTEEAKVKLGEAFPPQADEQLPGVEHGSDANVAKLERRALELGGIDPEVTKEHAEVEERFTFLSEQGEDLRKAKKDLEEIIGQLERKSRIIFREAFAKINEQFGVYFTKLFGGGKAELILVEEKPAEGEGVALEKTPEIGIEIKATPPGKRLQSLAMLSGGERALTSVALLFAILTVNPSPFVMLDEVDAALDEANTGRFADVLVDLADQTQFVVVTHNRDTMRVAAMLYGVTMDETGISTMLSLKLPEAEKVAQTA